MRRGWPHRPCGSRIVPPRVGVAASRTLPSVRAIGASVGYSGAGPEISLAASTSPPTMILAWRLVVLGGGGRGGYLPDSLRRLSKTPPLAPFGSPGEIPSNPPALGTGSVSSSGFEIGGMIGGAKRVEV